MTLQYSPDITDWAHVIGTIEREERYREKVKEARRREFKKKFIKTNKV